MGSRCNCVVCTYADETSLASLIVESEKKSTCRIRTLLNNFQKSSLPNSNMDSDADEMELLEILGLPKPKLAKSNTACFSHLGCVGAAAFAVAFQSVPEHRPP